MDVKWIMPKEIKQEDPVDYYLISSISEEQADVAIDPYSPHVLQVWKENLSEIV